MPRSKKLWVVGNDGLISHSEDGGRHWQNQVSHTTEHLTNVFFIDEKLSGLIDFYFACNDALAYDLAICLSAWCFEPSNEFNVSKGQALISAYERVRPLTGAEVTALPVLARGAALRFMLTRLVDWLNVPAGAKVAPKNPLEYRDKLRFHQRVRTVADYGLIR